jgi:hypothetical protein
MAQGEPQLTEVIIDGVDVISYLQSWDSDTTHDKAMVRGIRLVLVKDVDSVLSMDNEMIGKYVTVRRGVSSATERYIFRGDVTNLILRGSFYEVSCFDKLYRATKRTITKSYDKDIDAQAGVYSEIFLDLVVNHTNLDADATSVQNSGTLLTIQKFICRSSSVFDRLKEIADTLGWQMYYNPITGKVCFEPIGFVNQSTVISSGVNIIDTPDWNYDESNIYNVIELRGAIQGVDTVEDGKIGTDAGYTTEYVELDERPSTSVKVYSDAVDPPTTLLVGGIKGSTADYDYIVDQELRRIVWSDTYTAANDDFVIVDYTYNLPVPVIIKSQPSIDLYGEKKATLHKKDIVNVSDAENYATEYLNVHKDPILSARIKVLDVSDLNTGQKVRVIDTQNGIDDFFYIVKIRQSFPYRFDTITVVSNIIDTDLFSWEINQRVKRLEEENLGDDDLLLHIFGLDKNIKYVRRDAILQVRDTSVDGIWGRGFGNGVDRGDMEWGEAGAVWQGSYTYEPVIKQIIQGNNTYEELIYDDDYYDDVSSSGVVWDTAAKKITIG